MAPFLMTLIVKLIDPVGWLAALAVGWWFRRPWGIPVVGVACAVILESLLTAMSFGHRWGDTIAHQLIASVLQASVVMCARYKKRPSALPAAEPTAENPGSLVKYQVVCRGRWGGDDYTVVYTADSKEKAEAIAVHDGHALASTTLEQPAPEVALAPGQVRAEGSGSDRKPSRLRLVEVTPLAAAPIGLLYMLDEAGAFGRYPDWPNAGHWLWWLSLAAWSIEPAILRPLTYPARTAQERSIVLSLVGGAAISWWLWLGPDLARHYGINKVGLFLTLGLAAAAVVLRLGWGPIGLQPPAGGTDHPG